jgi:hypothetical protein
MVCQEDTTHSVHCLGMVELELNLEATTRTAGNQLEKSHPHVTTWARWTSPKQSQAKIICGSESSSKRGICCKEHGKQQQKVFGAGTAEQQHMWVKQCQWMFKMLFCLIQQECTV